MERLLADDWTLDPSVFDYKISFRPAQYAKGLLAESWEFPDPSTMVVHLRKGILWQNIPPINGREFIANDVVSHYQRLYGAGSGMTPQPAYVPTVLGTNLKAVTATDKYTITFSSKIPNPEVIFEGIQSPSGSSADIEAPDAVKQWGDVSDWHHAIGTGPFILQDFISGSSAILIKNPNYWGYDERYPQNKLPYVNALNILIIPDDATAMAGVRTGKLDYIEGKTIQDAQAIQNTNPEILQTIGARLDSIPTVDPRNDVKPFNDIRVRKAMQMALDLPTIAKSFYQGAVDPWPSTLTSNYMTGYGFPYNQWPQDLKDEYAYNPTAAKKLLSDAGYPNGFKTNVIAQTDSDLDLIQVVKSYFAAVGIDMSISTMDNATWTAYVRAGHKHDQLVFRNIGSLGLTYDPTHQVSRFMTGYIMNWVIVSDPVFDALSAKAMASTSADDMKQVLKDMNEYVARQHFAISLLQPASFNLYQPWLNGYNGQNQSGLWNAADHLVGFYSARFWIDQKLKKSMGH